MEAAAEGPADALFFPLEDTAREPTDLRPFPCKEVEADALVVFTALLRSCAFSLCWASAAGAGMAVGIISGRQSN